MTNRPNPKTGTAPKESNLGRRELLQILGVASLSTGFHPVCHAGGEKAQKVIVGAHPWVYAATQPNYDITPVLETIFADMKYAGMDGIELMHTALRPNGAVERIRALSQKYELPVIGTSFEGAMWDRSKHTEVLKDAEVVITRLSQLGGRTLGTSVGSAGRLKTAEELDAQAELLKKIIAFCEAHGVVLNLHNHTYEVENHLHDLKGTLARIPDVKLGPDLNWLLRGGVDPVWFIREYKERIVFLHLRDQKPDGEWSEALGEGSMDYKAIAQALREIPFTGGAVIELAHPAGFQLTRPLRESLKISRGFVRKVMGY
ncbi:MAG: sugar phosphate isomerase/epimerase family protein [bacterium]